MAKTIVQKVGSPDPDVSVFRISGTLGFHENKVLVKFFDECLSRNIRKLVLDLSELDSLGGGCAKIIRDAAQDGRVRVCVAGASRAVHGFLSGKGDSGVVFAPDVEQAVAGFRATSTLPNGAPRAEQTAGDQDPRARDAGAGGRESAGWPTRSAAPVSKTPPSRRDAGYARDVLTEVDNLLGDPAPAPSRRPPAPVTARRADESAGSPPVPGSRAGDPDAGASEGRRTAETIGGVATREAGAPLPASWGDASLLPRNRPMTQPS
jgi:anti-anti-sigma regulatory factor